MNDSPDSPAASGLTHFDAHGQAHMVDVGGKPETRRVARATGAIRMQPATLAAIAEGSAKKGDVLGVARIAAIQAAKRTSELVPLCHPLPLTHVQAEFAIDVAASAVHCTVQAETLGRTGVEMEALTAVQVGLLTVYDMVKAIDRGMVITDVRVLEKHGGKSGSWSAPAAMTAESFKPIPVKPPSSNPLLFRLRCGVDLQLGSIAKPLRPAMAALAGDVLDVGAGESPWREWLPEGCTYHGVDVANADDYGMRRQPDVTYYDSTTLPFPAARFDAAICIEVLEHVEAPEPFLAEIARVLRPRSTLLLTVPWSARRHHIPHDYHRFTRERLKILLERAGFERVDIRERGNDIAAIASKLVVLTIRLLRPAHFAAMVLTLPLAVLLGPLTVAMLVASHVSNVLGLGAKEDPLGYFVSAMRGARPDECA